MSNKRIPSKEPKIINTDLVMDLAAEIIRHFEGFSPVVYKCPTGRDTIGYGHALSKEELPKFKGKTITELDGEKLLYQDIKRVHKILVKNIDPDVYVSLSEIQLAALVSFVFNIGESNFKKSTFLKVLNETGNPATAAPELQRWVYSGSKQLPGLIRRRAMEKRLFTRE